MKICFHLKDPSDNKGGPLSIEKIVNEKKRSQKNHLIRRKNEETL
jgi:hypothetical protein